MSEAQKELVALWAAKYFGCCITYEESGKWAKGLLEVIENGERIKECLAIERKKEDNNAPATTGDVIDRKHDKPILI